MDTNKIPHIVGYKRSGAGMFNESDARKMIVRVLIDNEQDLSRILQRVYGEGIKEGIMRREREPEKSVERLVDELNP